MAAIVEAYHDRRGILWPVAVAPFEVVITLLRPDLEEVRETAERIYKELTDSGVETLLDDRKERPGVKFADAELIGVPYRLTIGPRSVASGQAELLARDGAVDESVSLADVTHRIRELLR